MTALALPKDREAWLEERRRGIGGSDAAAVVGLDPYKSAFRLWLEKTGQVKPEPAGEAAEWGKRLEPLVAEEFAVRHPEMKVRRHNKMLTHREYPFVVANIDRMLVGPQGRGVLEIKTTGARHADEWGPDRAPAQYIVQIQHYLAVTGLNYGWFAVLIGGQQYREVRIERDEELIRQLIEAEARFWQMVEEGTPPPADGSEDATELLERLYPEAKAEATVLPPQADELCRQYLQATAEIRRLEKVRDEAANRLKQLMGEYEIGRYGHWEIRWKNVTTSRLDIKALRDSHPGIAQYYTVTSTYRKFEVKEVE